MKKSNKGFTLFELIVVIIIIGIAVTYVGMSINAARSADARHAAAEIDSYISKCRTACLSRTGNVYIKIYNDDSSNEIVGEYYEGNPAKLTETDILGGSHVVCTYTVGSSEYNIADAPLYISFERDTGSEHSQQETAAKVSPLPTGVPYISSSACSKITLTGGELSYTITIVPTTGSHSVSSGGAS